jgi:hypothetical protein
MSEDGVYFTIRGNCDKFEPELVLGKHYVKRGPKAKLAEGIVAWDVTIDGKQIRNLEKTKNSFESIMLVMGILPPLIIFLISLTSWRDGRWKGFR